jgi:hypothetical protein
MTNGNEMLQDARRYVRASLGGDLEEKASDEFCIAVLSSQVAGPPAGAIAALEVLETVAPSFGPGPVATVLEFEHGTATGSATEAEAAGDPATRQTRIKAMRDSSYQVVGTVYDEIERLTGGLLRADREVVGAPRIPSLVTQVCWLNRTVRACPRGSRAHRHPTAAAARRVDQHGGDRGACISGEDGHLRRRAHGGGDRLGGRARAPGTGRASRAPP